MTSYLFLSSPPLNILHKETQQCHQTSKPLPNITRIPRPQCTYFELLYIRGTVQSELLQLLAAPTDMDKMRPTFIGSRTMLISLALYFRAAQALNTCTPPTPLDASHKTNFTACLSTIQNMTMGQRRDSGCFESSDNGILTLDGCRLMCGSKIQFWDWKDTFSRLSLLVIPTAILIAHAAFPPLGWRNYLIVIVHTVGNPIGSIRSILTRFEKHRRFRRAAEAQFPNNAVISGAIATVLAAYEELGWYDLPATNRMSENEISIIIRASHELSSTRLVSIFPASVAIATLVTTLASAIVRTIRQINENNTRIDIENTHTIAVVCILLISIPQVWFSARLGTFTTESGAIHILYTMNRHLNILGGEDRRSIFPAPERAASCPLQYLERRPWFFRWLSGRLPEWLRLHPASLGFSWLEKCLSQCPLENGTQFSQVIQNWQKNSSYLSMNCSWRPCNHLDRNGTRPSILLWMSVLWVVMGACLPALFLSATNHTDTRKIAIGCRSLSWIGIMVGWLLSFALDSIFRGLTCLFSSHLDPIAKARRLRLWAILKDSFMTAVVLALVLVVEVGAYNNCLCRASFSHPAIVNLMPYLAPQWAVAWRLWISIPSFGLLVNFVLIMCVELRVKRKFPWLTVAGGSSLCKSGSEMEKELGTLIERGEELRPYGRGLNVREGSTGSQSLLSSTNGLDSQNGGEEDNP